MFTFTKRKTVRQNPAKNRVIKASQWIHTNELKMGMYVSELDRPWEKTDFMFQGFVIDSIKQLQRVQDQAEYVNVVTAKTTKVAANDRNRMVSQAR